MKVLGLDPSLTAFGVAYAGSTLTWKAPKAVGLGVDRLHWFAQQLEALCDDTQPDIALIEGYAFNAKANREVLGELGGVVRLSLFRSEVPFVVVPPAKLKKFTTDKGNADKDTMLASAIRRWDFNGVSNNEADAWMLYLMGVYQFNDPDGAGLSPLPVYAATVLKAIEWPDLVAA